jgi:branched-subunit amino acid ABC-type transport system permease component
MPWTLVFEQLLNGIQLGVTLFLMAAGLTLVLGIMNLVNLAHGSLYTACVVEAEVDPATGWITVPKIWIAHDIGRTINPVLARGQVEGSVCYAAVSAPR